MNSPGFRLLLSAATGLLWIASGALALGLIPGRESAEVAGVSGLRAPAFSLRDTEGRRIGSDDLRGRYALVDFWATWCPPCRQSIPELAKLHREFSRRGFQVVGINMDEEPEGVPRFARKFEIPYPVLLGGRADVGDRFGVTSLPTFFLLDPQGRIVKGWVGFHDGLPRDWRALLNRLL